LGGDEFVGLLFYDETKIKWIAENILKQTQQLRKKSWNFKKTVSIGIVQATKRDDVVRKADRVMYEAKQRGKNQYIFTIEE